MKNILKSRFKSITLQKVSFCVPKGKLLACKRPPIRGQKLTFYNTLNINILQQLFHNSGLSVKYNMGRRLILRTHR